MTTKNNELPTKVGEAKTDIVLENKESQSPEENNSVQEVCETEVGMEIPSPGYEEFGEPPKTETEEQANCREGPMNQGDVTDCTETETETQGEESTGKNGAFEKVFDSETETEERAEKVHLGKEFSKPNEIPQTDREIRDVIADGAVDVGVITGADMKIVEMSLNAEESNETEDESVKPKKKRGLLKLGKKAKENVESETVTEKKSKKKSGKTSSPEPETETKVTSKQEDDVVETKEKKKTRTRAKPVQQIMTIDGERTVQTDSDKARNDLIDLLESFKSGKVMTGIIQGVERTTDDNQPFAVIYHGAFKIIIPASELIDEPTDYRGLRPKDVQHYLLTKRLGAEIDFIVKGVETKNNLAVASRKEAMRAKRKAYYYGHDREGNNLLYVGICAEARVVSVIRSGIFVDVFGVETFIALKELSYQRVVDASQYYQSGQRILVKILDIDKTDRNDIKVKVSVKQAAENPYEKALRKYTTGNCYVGTVGLVDTTGVFVALDGGIDCLCSYPKRGRPPRGARVTVRILGINYDSNRIWGAITHIATPR